MKNMELSAYLAHEKETTFDLIPILEDKVTTEDVGFVREVLAAKGYKHTELRFYCAIALIWRLGVAAGIRTERKRRHHTNE